MKKNILKPTRIFTAKFYLKLLLVLPFFWASCSTNDELTLDLGLNEFPSDTMLLTDVRVQTHREDSQRTDNLNFHVLGSVNDSVFGVSKSTIYSQLGLGGTVTIPSNAEVDSVIMQLAFVDYYGDFDAVQNFSVYTLADSIDKGSVYYNTSKVALGKKIGSLNNFALGVNKGYFKIDVTKLWGENALAPGKTYSNETAFQKDLLGIAIVPETDFNDIGGVLYYFNLVSNTSFINAYYHYYTRDGENLTREAGTAEMQFRTNSKSFTSFTHNYDNEIVSSVLSPDSSNAINAYVQALGGTYTSISIPQIKNLIDSPLLVFHKVELVLPCEVDFHSDDFEPIPFLDIKTFNDNGSLVDVADKAKVYWVRAYDRIERAYVFNITNHAQLLLNSYRTNADYVDKGLVVKAIKNEPIPFSAGRFVMKGSAAKRKDGAHLRIFYSEIDKP